MRLLGPSRESCRQCRRILFAVRCGVAALTLALSTWTFAALPPLSFASPSGVSSFPESRRREAVWLGLCGSVGAGMFPGSALATPRKNFVETSSGLQYRIIKEGTGDLPEQGRQIRVDYIGWLDDFNSKTVFDTTREPGTERAPDKKLFQFRLGEGRVIQGWEEALATMRQGERRFLIVPPELAYGDAYVGDIPPGSTLFFDLELRKILQPPSQCKENCGRRR